MGNYWFDNFAFIRNIIYSLVSYEVIWCGGKFSSLTPNAKQRIVLQETVRVATPNAGSGMWNNNCMHARVTRRLCSRKNTMPLMKWYIEDRMGQAPLVIKFASISVIVHSFPPNAVEIHSQGLSWLCCLHFFTTILCIICYAHSMSRNTLLHGYHLTVRQESGKLVGHYIDWT